MNAQRFGDTWRVRQGSRGGIQIRRRAGGLGPVQVRETWGDLGVSEVEVDREWRKKGYSLDRAANTPIWGAIVARTALQMAAHEAPSNRGYFEELKRRAAAKYGGSPVPSTLRSVLSLIGRSAPKARAWLVERARRYAVAFEGYSAPKGRGGAGVADGQREIKFKPPVEQSSGPPTEGLLEQVKPYAGWIAGGVAALVAVLVLTSRRADAPQG